MPAWVSADALSVVGVPVPDIEAGEIAAGAIVEGTFVYESDSMCQNRLTDTLLDPTMRT